MIQPTRTLSKSTIQNALEYGSVLHRGVLVIWDEDRDQRILKWIDSLPIAVRLQLRLAHEHDGILYLAWVNQPPPGYGPHEDGGEVRINGKFDDHWTLEQSSFFFNPLTHTLNPEN